MNGVSFEEEKLTATPRSEAPPGALARLVIRVGWARTAAEAQRVLGLIALINLIVLAALVWWMRGGSGEPLSPTEVEQAGSPGEIQHN